MFKRQHRGWAEIGPGTWQPSDDEQEASAVFCPAVADIKTSADPDPDEQMSSGITYQQCGGGRRILRKRIGGN